MILGVAGPASAYPGGCEADEFGRCTFAPYDPNAVEWDPADIAAYGTTPDQHFAYHLTHDDDAPFRITDFNIQKSQALRVCQQVASGMELFDAAEELENFGGYTWDQAATLAAAASIIYCP